MMILRRVVSTFYTNMLCYLGSQDRCNYWLCSLDVDNDNDVHDVDDDDDDGGGGNDDNRELSSNETTTRRASKNQ